MLHTAATTILLKSKGELVSSLLHPCSYFLFAQRMIWSPYYGLWSLSSDLLSSSSSSCSLCSSRTPLTTTYQPLHSALLCPSAPPTPHFPYPHGSVPHLFRSWLSCHLLMEAFQAALFKNHKSLCPPHFLSSFSALFFSTALITL